MMGGTETIAFQISSPYSSQAKQDIEAVTNPTVPFQLCHILNHNVLNTESRIS